MLIALHQHLKICCIISSPYQLATTEAHSHLRTHDISCYQKNVQDQQALEDGILSGNNYIF